MNEKPGGVPLGWKIVSLADIAVPSREKAEPSSFKDSQYIGLEHIEGETNRILGTGDSTSVKSTKAVFRAGDVLYGKLRPYLNKVCRPDFDGVCSTDILVFPKSQHLDNGYLLNFLSSTSTTEYATQNSSGINLPRISAKKLGEIEFPLAPLAEQRRIVAKIELLQGRFQKAREQLGEVRPLLDKYRQSLLAAALRGDLTAGWREQNHNLEPAIELLTRIRAERRRKWEEAERAKCEAKGKKLPKNWKEKYQEPASLDDSELPKLPSHWCWATFDTFLEFVTSGSRGWGKYYSKTGALFIRSQNINADVLVLDDVAHVSPPSGSEGIRTRIHQNDLLITITGANVARAAVVKTSIDEAYVSQHVALARPVDPYVSGYLHLWIVSPENGRSQLLGEAYGNGKPGLNLDNLKQLKVAVAPLEEQRQILQIIQSALSGIDAIGGIAAESKSALMQLDQSILAKAFRGELVPQDSDDEPASVLVERIREVRAQQKETTKGKSKKTRPAMRQSVSDKLMEWIKTANGKSFTFNDLRREIACDYDELKEAVFTLLDEKSEVEQVFDESSRSVCFRGGSK